jgi:septum formation protein
MTNSLPTLKLPLILGSASPVRGNILRALGLTFTTMSPNIDEKLIRHDDPDNLAVALAAAKARVIIESVQNAAIIITADQVVVVADEIREKPADPDEARRFLRSYRTLPAETVSAVQVYNTSTNKSAVGVDRVKVYLKDLSDEIIEAIIAEGTIFHCAGGFAVEHPLMEPLVEKIDGELESIMGMPIALTCRLLWEVA